MELAGLRPKARKTYLESIVMLSKHFDGSPAKLTQEDLRGWVRHLLGRGVRSVPRSRSGGP